MHKLCSALARLSDSELVSEVKRLAANERHATSELVASIAALDARRIYLAEGYPSTHAYLVEALGFSNDAAFYRITAARAVQKFPGILEKLRTGALTLKAIRLLAPHLDEANHEEILDAAAHKSADEILHLLAARNPRPDVPASIRKLPEGRGAQPVLSDRPAGEDTPARLPHSGDGGGLAVVVGGRGAAAATPMNGVAAEPAPAPSDRDQTSGAGAFAFCGNSQAATFAPDLAKNGPVKAPPEGDLFVSPFEAAAKRRPVVEPLSPGRYKLQVTISAETRAKLQRAQDLLRHQVPDGDFATILDRALTLLVEDVERKKAAIVRRPRTAAKRASQRPAHETTTGSAPSPAKAAMERGLDSDTAAPRRQQSLSAATNGETAGGQAGRPRARDVSCPEPRAASRARSRHIPAAVRREVWRRDEGRCAYVSPGGKRCGATSGLEFHHVVPFAAGGEATVDNVIVACRKHNDHEAERFFGTDCAPRSRTATGITGERSHVPGHVKNCQLWKSRQGR